MILYNLTLTSTVKEMRTKDNNDPYEVNVKETFIAQEKSLKYFTT